MIRRWPRQAQRASFSHYRNEPVAFCHDVLGVEPWSKQVQILSALSEHDGVTVRSCNGAGKTICAAWAGLWYLTTRPGSIVITTAPTGYQVRDLLWRRWRQAFQDSQQSLPGRIGQVFHEVGTNWYAKGFSTDQEVNFQGPHSPAGVMLIGDEASGLPPWLYAAMQGSMTEPDAKMLLIGNPNNKHGFFYETHRTWPLAQRIHIAAHEVPAHILDPVFIGRMARDYGEESPQYQVRVLGEFPEQDEDALLASKWVEEAQRREGVNAQGAVEIGVDVARFGSDESVAYARRGGMVLSGQYWRGYDTLASAGRVARLGAECAASTVKVDDPGIGGGVTDQLRALERDGTLKARVDAVNVGMKALDSEKFYDRRSELYWGLRERFRAGDISIPADDTVLADQLTQIRFSYTPRGQIRIEPKDEMKKRRPPGTRWQSPDRADALMLAFAPGGNAWIPVCLAGEGVDTTPKGIG